MSMDAGPLFAPLGVNGARRLPRGPGMPARAFHRPRHREANP